jgi:hypothetical protein
MAIKVTTKHTTHPFPIKELGRYFWFQNGILMHAEMYPNGVIKKNTSEVMSKPNAEEMSLINNKLNVRLTYTDFLTTKRRRR